MSERIRELPDALVLGAGGTLGEAWLRGVLAGRGRRRARLPRVRVPDRHLGRLDRRRPLAAGKRPEAGESAAREGARRRAAGGDRRARATDARRAKLGGALARGAARAGKAAATPFAPLALATTRPAGRLARAAVLSRAPRPDTTLEGSAATSSNSAGASTAGYGSRPSIARAASA